MPTRRMMPTAEQLANLAKLFPPTPPRSAELVVVLAGRIVMVPVQMSRGEAAATGFADRRQDGLGDLQRLADELLQRFGVTIASDS